MSGGHPCFTIGHSNRNMADFIKLLGSYSIELVYDVRSAPYSKFVPHFNRKNLSARLEREGMAYRFMGNLIGGKPSNPDLLGPDGKVDFHRILGSEAFSTGIDSILGQLEGGARIALMCSERDPLRCHRFFLVSRVLKEWGVHIAHIIDEEKVLSMKELEDMLLEERGMDPGQTTLFGSGKERGVLLERAYEELMSNGSDDKA